MNFFKLKGRITSSLTDQQFRMLLDDNKHLHIEKEGSGALQIAAMKGPGAMQLTARILNAISQWNAEKNEGKVLSGLTGFKMEDGAVRMPAGAWVSNDKWEQFEQAKLEFFPGAPDFVFEVRGFMEGPDLLRAKMKAWIEQGAQLAWLIEKGRISIFRKDGSMDMMSFGEEPLSGENVMEGFMLDFSQS